jgi:hypothetical protein
MPACGRRVFAAVARPPLSWFIAPRASSSAPFLCDVRQSECLAVARAHPPPRYTEHHALPRTP